MKPFLLKWLTMYYRPPKLYLDLFMCGIKLKSEKCKLSAELLANLLVSNDTLVKNVIILSLWYSSTEYVIVVKYINEDKIQHRL